MNHLGLVASMQSALRPVTYFGISSAISLLALNVSQVGRVYCAPFLLLFALLSFRHLNDIPSWLGLNSLWGLFVTINVMHITTVFYIEKWVLVPGNDDDDESVVGMQDHQQRSASWKLKAAYKVWSNPRWLPPTPTSSNNNNTEVLLGDVKNHQFRTNAKRLTMTSFVLVRTTTLCVYGLIHRQVATYKNGQADSPCSVIFMAHGRLGRHISARELINCAGCTYTSFVLVLQATFSFPSQEAVNNINSLPMLTFHTTNSH